MAHVSNFALMDYGQRITYIGGEVSFDKMGAAEYEFGAIDRALTGFGLMSRDEEINITETVLDFTSLPMYETRPLTEKWACFHAKDTPPPPVMQWIRAKSAPCLISTVAILPLGRIGPTTRETIAQQPKLLYIRKSVVGTIRQAVKLYIFDKAHALAEEFVRAQS